MRNSDSRSPRRDDVVVKLSIARRIEHVHATAEDGDGISVCSKRGTMSGRIDAPGHSADNCQASFGQIRAEAFGRGEAIWSRAAGTDNCQRIGIDQLRIAEREKRSSGGSKISRSR